ncbi:glycosyl hydrolase 53 family protein [Pontibacter sp. G13]|uniref:glycosyl hydrolase 53 family protein n=1 Tax=Pontibacter sp. G13 TaxID=3074898 RepID=UPI00288B6700|nr:glycosyl hydrolase 53 family protein [Pontibacter sp. G13]WNJ19389.1 glycosyl hydrolase 53 family protein [Pontibacter sp. G13]
MVYSRLCWFSAVLMSVWIWGCQAPEPPVEPNPSPPAILSLDLSEYQALARSGFIFRDAEGTPVELLSFCREKGVDLMRLRLWKEAQNPDHGWDSVGKTIGEIRGEGMGIWLTVHLSDTWADPGHQSIPPSWQGLTFEELRDSVSAYFYKIASEWQPEVIQIGNEINSGFLLPYGHRFDHPWQYQQLIAAATHSIRAASPRAQIMLHFAGLDRIDAWLADTDLEEIDLIGVSLYPQWHGKDLSDWEQKLKQAHDLSGLPIWIAETAYPFTLDWGDWTHNLVGEEEQLILPAYPATFEGQADFVEEMMRLASLDESGGLSYWGAAAVPFDGEQGTEGSCCENTALFDFEGNAVPAWGMF